MVCHSKVPKWLRMVDRIYKYVLVRRWQFSRSCCICECLRQIVRVRNRVISNILQIMVQLSGDKATGWGTHLVQRSCLILLAICTHGLYCWFMLVHECPRIVDEVTDEVPCCNACAVPR